MYKLLIVDDEQIVVDSMTHILNKNFGDEIELRTAKSGIKAIEQAIDFNPDIVYMDINIPGIKGLDAIKEIKKVVSNAEYYIISAYDKFSFAKEAIQLGVIDYILKPLKKEKLIEITLDAFEKVDNNRLKRMENLKLRERAEMFSPMAKDNLMYNIMFKEHSIMERERYFDLLNLDEREGYILIVNFMNENQDNFREELNRVSSALRDRIDSTKCIYGSIIDNKIIMFVMERKKKTDYFDRIVSVKLAENTADSLRSISELKFRIGIGSNKTIDKLTLSFDEANRAILLGEEELNYFPDIESSDEEVFDIYTFSDEFTSALNSLEEAELENFFDKNYDFLKKQANNKIKILQTFIIKLLIDIETQFETDSDNTLIINNNDISEMFLLENDKKIKSFFIKKCELIRKIQSETSENSYSEYVKYTINYLKKNFKSEISLEEIAAEQFISPQYLSKLFKEELGKNYIDYLNEIRVNQAIELLEKSSMNVKEIAFEVGYNDPNYFSRIFKKWTKFTPKQYRKNYNL